jgi:chromosome segregation ATPase
MPASVADPINASPPPSNRLSSNMRRASPGPLPAYQTPPPARQNGTSTNNNSTTMNGSPGPTAMGRSGLVIEKLTADNDRLRREIKAERAAKDELVEQQKLLKAMLGKLEEKNSILKLQFDTHDGALARKERRMDDLKAHLETEVERRKKAEDREAEMGRKLGEITQEASKAVSEAKMKQKQSEGAYNTVSKEYLDLKGSIQTLTKDFTAYKKTAEFQRSEREQRFVQLEVLLDQKRQAMEQATRVNREQSSILAEYKEQIGDVTIRRKEMIETTQKMRWLMGVHRARQSETDGDEEEDEDDEEEDG